MSDPIACDDTSVTPATNVVVLTSAAARETAAVLARSLALPLVDELSAETPLYLLPSTEGLQLGDARDGARLNVDFTAEEVRRYRAGGGGRNPLRRAMGATPRTVVDASAGLGRDTVHLAVLGYRVTAIERHPVVSALTQDGLARARAAGLLSADNPRWYTGDARTILLSLDPRPDTIYLDPMFPAKRKKSAAVRKEMRLLRSLVADDDDAHELLAIARRYARDRVVVKRPDEAPPLAPNPTASYNGKLVRYDVYRTAT